MVARRPRPDARSLVMAGGRSIPRPPQAPPSRPAPPPDDTVPNPLLRKAAGELAAVWAQIAGCSACGRSDAPRAYGTGHPQAPVMLLKGRPAPEDLETSNAFAAEAEALAKAFDALGIPSSWLYGTTALRCGEAPSEPGELRACSAHLLAEIEAVCPRVLVAFGPEAAEAIATLDGRCGLVVPAEPSRGEPVAIRSELVLLVTEPLPEGVTAKDAKRRLWRDLRLVPELVGS